LSEFAKADDLRVIGQSQKDFAPMERTLCVDIDDGFNLSGELLQRREKMLYPAIVRLTHNFDLLNVAPVNLLL
jgi:hypothetical protein